jgi:hypothetical protein
MSLHKADSVYLRYKEEFCYGVSGVPERYLF